jgi:adenosylhomocysteine nucleosidase
LVGRMNPSTVCNVALVAALNREISALVKNWTRTQREYGGRQFTFFERDDMVAVCGGIGLEPARRAAEAVIALYRPARLHSVGFAGALHKDIHVSDIFSPAVVIDSRDGSRTQLEGGEGTLVTFMAVADAIQKAKLAESYGARAVDMEAAAVAAAARTHGITFDCTKVISDELDFEMPIMTRFINSEGRFKTESFALSAAFRPWLWKPLVALASNSRKAAQALSSHLERCPNDLVAPTPAPGATTVADPVHTGGRK